jgi:hypothetical protein
MLLQWEVVSKYGWVYDVFQDFCDQDKNLMPRLGGQLKKNSRLGVEVLMGRRSWKWYISARRQPNESTISVNQIHFNETRHIKIIQN